MADSLGSKRRFLDGLSVWAASEDCRRSAGRIRPPRRLLLTMQPGVAPKAPDSTIARIKSTFANSVIAYIWQISMAGNSVKLEFKLRR
jgi:hypothetical protein